MKKVMRHLLVILVSLLTCLPAMAEYTPAQKAFRTSIVSYLRGEGYSPTIDEDGDIRFKKEGDLYWIHIDGGGEKSFYVEFHGPSLGLGDANKAVSMMACNYVNYNTKCVKAMMNDERTSISFTVELFCTEPADFKDVFERCLNVLQQGSDDAQQYYADHAKE